MQTVSFKKKKLLLLCGWHKMCLTYSSPPTEIYILIYFKVNYIPDDPIFKPSAVLYASRSFKFLYICYFSLKVVHTFGHGYCQNHSMSTPSLSHKRHIWIHFETRSKVVSSGVGLGVKEWQKKSQAHIMWKRRVLSPPSGFFYVLRWWQNPPNGPQRKIEYYCWLQ